MLCGEPSRSASHGTLAIETGGCCEEDFAWPSRYFGVGLLRECGFDEGRRSGSPGCYYGDESGCRIDCRTKQGLIEVVCRYLGRPAEAFARVCVFHWRQTL